MRRRLVNSGCNAWAQKEEGGAQASSGGHGRGLPKLLLNYLSLYKTLMSVLSPKVAEEGERALTRQNKMGKQLKHGKWA